MRDSGSLGADGIMDVAVPTGNFGNILAAWYAKRMGLPIGRLICASNRNRVLADFFREKRYDRNRPFYKTESPSMDILVSSNLERLVFHATDDDPQRTASLMKELTESGSYTLTDSEAEGLSDFRAGWADEAEAGDSARRLFESAGYLVDPHTAVAVSVLEKMREEYGEIRPTLVAATASPFKFPMSVARAIGLDGASAPGAFRGAGSTRAEALVELDMAERLSREAKVDLPDAIRALRDAPELHSAVVESCDMEAALERSLG